MTMNPEALRKSVSVDVGGRKMTFETGWLAKQAPGAVLVRYDHSAVLTTCVSADPRPGIDFFPLTVEYREKTGAAGKIPGGFFKREGRPTTKETLTCRLIDRPMRPLFKDGYNDEVQVIATVLSADKAHDPDVCGMNGASMATMLAGLPFEGPVASVRVGMKNNELIINPTYEELLDSDLQLIMAGTMDAITMVEAGANELSEKQVIDALAFGHDCIRDICKAQLELLKLAKAAKNKWTAPEAAPADLVKACQPYYDAFRKAVKVKNKAERKDAVKAAKDTAIEKLIPKPADNATKDQLEAAAKRAKYIKEIVGEFHYKAIRDTIVEENLRIDGRKTNEIRQIICEIQPFPRTHGSSIFTRGETQAFVNVTLGTAEDTQLIDGLQPSYEERFLLHYNFPPFCTGEVKFLRSASRREIGHGALAERAIRPLLPPENECPYTLRVVSDVLESNGSSSMATVCGSSLALFDAGVPMKRAVAGIAMGLIKEGKTVRVLSDILGDEDHCGDMDFKVCGTEQGITALQMDIKIAGLSKEIMETALNQAREGRLHILGVMAKALPAPRAEISPYAPRYEMCKIPPDKIGKLIGPGGKNIRALQERTKSTISVEDDGTVKIFCEDGAGALQAKQDIDYMMKDIEIGDYFEGPVTSIKDFGVFVDIKPGVEGMCHVSELTDSYVDNPADVIQLGDVRKFKVINVDPVSGKVKLSAKAVILEERGEEYVPAMPRGGGRGGDRGGRGGDRGGRGGGGYRGGGDRGPRNRD